MRVHPPSVTGNLNARFAGMALFMAEVDRRGYQVAENAGQFIIFCNRAPIRWLTPPR